MHMQVLSDAKQRNNYDENRRVALHTPPWMPPPAHRVYPLALMSSLTRALQSVQPIHSETEVINKDNWDELVSGMSW